MFVLGEDEPAQLDAAAVRRDVDGVRVTDEVPQLRSDARSQHLIRDVLVAEHGFALGDEAARAVREVARPLVDEPVQRMHGMHDPITNERPPPRSPRRIEKVHEAGAHPQRAEHPRASPPAIAPKPTSPPLDPGCHGTPPARVPVQWMFRREVPPMNV